MHFSCLREKCSEGFWSTGFGPKGKFRKSEFGLNARFLAKKQQQIPAIQLITPEAVKKFIIAGVCLSATLASNAPAKDKKHIQAAQDALIYQGAIMRFPNGNGFVFSIGPFPIIVPPLIVQTEVLTGTPSRVSHP